MKKLRDRIWAIIKPAFDEAWVYPCAMAGVILSPIVVTAATGEYPKFRVHWWDWGVALVITVIVLMLLEMKGDAEGKRTTVARWRRYGFGFLGGLAWRQVVPAVIRVVVGAFEALAKLIGL